MRFIDEYRNKDLVEKLSAKIKSATTKAWTIMEVCGGQTHAILKYNLFEYLPDKVEFIHGPGCPVCVTPIELIDKAIAISLQKNVILTSYGDMLRVPGSEMDLFQARAKGADVRIVFSPLDAVKIAVENPLKMVVFFAVGFETTAPANAMSLIEARRRNLTNFSLLAAHVLVPPAIEAVLNAENSRIQGFIAAGHVCTVMGYQQYMPLAQKYKVPIVVGGFEPVDLMQAVYELVLQLEAGSCDVINAYSRVVTPEGNLHAKKTIETVFEVTDQKWRGIGLIPNSGLKINPDFEAFDAEKIFSIQDTKISESEHCMAGLVLQGHMKPTQCKAFSNLCTPENPLGAPMVSSEGACAAYFHYHKT
ncbi:MAG: hydrogenase formation protein HypD [Bacteroidales bacterium]